MKINIDFEYSSIGIQIFDSLYAYRQSLNSECSSDWKITFNQAELPNDCSVLFAVAPSDLSVEEVKKYDLVFMCNGGEPLTVATPAMTELIKQDNTYLIANSFLTRSHQLVNKVFTWPDAIMQCRDYWCRHFYPQYFENLRNTNQKKKWPITAINGQNRTWRHWLFSELLTTVPNINIVSNISSSIEKLNDPHWASNEDIEFHKWINAHFEDTIPEPDSYYANSKCIGIQGKFGDMPPGYFIMSEYWQSECVLWPESTWQNNELCITEKACKCFYSQTIPWPVGGANIHALYNEQGFNTAWNLLPPEHREFDSILDHKERYHALVRALHWASKNPGIFSSDQAKSILHSNQTHFLLCASDVGSVINIDKLFQQYAK
jgi:hypothetical protein